MTKYSQGITEGFIKNKDEKSHLFVNKSVIALHSKQYCVISKFKFDKWSDINLS